MNSSKCAIKIVIPKIFEYDSYIFHLKRELKGQLIITNNSYQFRGDSNKIIINGLMPISEYEIINKLKNKIVTAYNNNSINKLSNEDKVLFELIDYVMDKTKNRKKVLFIGYKYNYPNTIKTIVQICNFDCETFLLSQNIELYNPRVRLVDNNCDTIFKSIMGTVENGNYDNYIVNVPNLNLIADDYTNTKKLLSYLKSKNKKMIILHSNSKNRFNKIFGTTYDDIIMEENYFIKYGRCEVVKNKIKDMLS